MMKCSPKRFVIVCSVIAVGVTLLVLPRAAVPRAVPTALVPSVALDAVSPLEDGLTREARLFLTSWTVTFPVGASAMPPVTHAGPRHIVVEAGALRLVSDDQASRLLLPGERAVIRPGAWHTFKNEGPTVGRLHVTGAVVQALLHDACGGP